MKEFSIYDQLIYSLFWHEMYSVGLRLKSTDNTIRLIWIWKGIGFIQIQAAGELIKVAKK